MPIVVSMPRPILTAAEVAELMGCSVKGIEERARSGELPGLLWGDGGWRFPAEATIASIAALAIAEADQRRRDRLAPPKALAKPNPGRHGRRVPPALPLVGMPAS